MQKLTKESVHVQHVSVVFLFHFIWVSLHFTSALLKFDLYPIYECSVFKIILPV